MRIGFSRPNFYRYHPTHGPQVWPWWKLVTFKFVKLTVRRPSTGYTVWMYTRWGAWSPVDLYFWREDAA